jgi:uncharacterized protein (TIGR03086 family)
MTTTDRTAVLLHDVLDHLADVVANIPDNRLHDPTPCSEMDVAALRSHVLSWLTTFAAGLADPDGQTPDISSYQPTADPAAEVRQAADTIGAALAAGAAQRPLRIGAAAMPGDLALGMILWEYQVHGWDLARATGQPFCPPAEAAAASLAFAPGMLTPDYQGPGKAFADRVPVHADAPPLDRLVGLSGRDPGWSATR